MLAQIVSSCRAAEAPPNPRPCSLFLCGLGSLESMFAWSLGFVPVSLSDFVFLSAYQGSEPCCEGLAAPQHATPAYCAQQQLWR
jgi:hypothetical protein